MAAAGRSARLGFPALRSHTAPRHALR